MKRSVCLLVIILLSAGANAEKNKITVEKFLSFQYPKKLAVDPAGKKVAYTVRTANFSESKWETRLWMLDPESESPRQLTFGPTNTTQPEWSPDGRWITFLGKGKDPEENEQLWALPTAGGEAVQWGQLSRGVDDYNWSPGGDFLLLISKKEKPAEISKREKSREKLNFDEVVKDSVRENRVVWRLNPADGNLTRVAELDPGIDDYSISHNGRWMVYQTNYTGEFDDAQKYDLWVLDLQTGAQHQLTDFSGPETHPRFSPDDKRITYIAQTTPDVEFAETDLWVMPFFSTPAGGQPENLTAHFNLSVLDYHWQPAGKKLVIRVAEGTETHLYGMSPEPEAELKRITHQAGNVQDFVLRRKKIIGLWEDVDHLPEIVRLDNKKVDLLSNFSRQLEPFTLGSQSVYRWKSIDGQEIEGLLFLPPDFDPARKYPLILAVHGGPYGRVRQAVRQSHYKQTYAADGYVVLAPNPRGSSGYDDAFGKAIWFKHGGHMGGIDYHDIMSGVNALIQEGYIDEERMGVIGGSYGGYLVNWIISQTDRFAAAVSQFGIFSWFTDWSLSWQPAFEKMYFGIYYWERPIGHSHPYIKYSPAFYVENIKTPVLILQGEKDRYTNYGNSAEMYQALKTLGRDVKFVVYPRENHGMSREPNHRRNVVHRSKKWLDFYLKND